MSALGEVWFLLGLLWVAVGGGMLTWRAADRDNGYEVVLASMLTATAALLYVTAFA